MFSVSVPAIFAASMIEVISAFPRAKLVLPEACDVGLGKRTWYFCLLMHATGVTAKHATWNNVKELKDGILELLL